jgi:PhnB protein
VSHPTAPAPYLHFAGTAREALTFYAHVFGGSVELHTFEDFHRTDGPAEAVAHGYLKGSPVLLFAADAAGDQLPLRCEGLMLSLLGTADASTLKEWFAKLSDGGRVVDDLQVRPWGASDGQVIDRFGVHWLVGFEDDQD